MRVLPPDVQQIVDRAADAELLLQNDAFVRVMNDLSNFHLTAMVASPEGPAGSDAREYHHRMLSALQEITGTLNSHIIAASPFVDTPPEESDEEMHNYV